MATILEEICVEIGQVLTFGKEVKVPEVTYFDQNGKVTKGKFSELYKLTCGPYSERTVDRRNLLGLLEDLPIFKKDRILNSNMTTFLKTLKELAL